MGNCPKDVFHGDLGDGAGSGPPVGLTGRVLKGIITVSPDRLRTVIVCIDKYKSSISRVFPCRVSRSSWRWSGWILVTSLLTGVVMGRTPMI